MQKPELGVATTNSEGREDRGSKAPNVVSVSVAETICDANYRISGKVNKICAVLLLDTGAHVSICSLSTAMKYGIGTLKRSEIVGVVGLGEHTVQILGVADIILEIAGCKIVTSVFVVEKEIGRNGKYDLIIGRNTLKKLPLLLDLQNGSLTQKDGGIFVCERSAVTERKTCSKKQMEEQLEELNECIQKYSNVFSKHEYDLGECVFEAPPILTTSAMPERVKPYPVPEKYEEELKKHIKKMLEADIIRESCTPWAHNIVLVKKTNGQLRPCVDFRPLNKITLPDPYPIPRMDKTILRVSGKKWYSTLDLASGFWQIPLDEQSSDKCGIVTPWGLYQMRKLSFGLKNAPSIFQRVMDKILGDLKNVTAYIDDILIHTNTEKEHLEALAKVFTELEKSGLKLKREKCVFMKNKCTYLGHILDEAGYRPSLNNQEVIQAFPEPKNVKEIKRFLGMISFFRKFIPNFAAIAHPLNEMTKGNNQICGLTDEGSQAFKQLKIKLLEAPCLQAPDYGKCFYLFTDASAVAYAGALMQAKNDNEMHAVGYWSRTLSPAESKLPPTHSELAAIVCAVQNFKPIIYGADLTILTDHRPLSFLFSKACTNPKLNRWLMELQEFEPKVIYVEGKANKVADALSRVSIEWGQITEKNREGIPYQLTIEGKEELSRTLLEKETVKDQILSQVLVKVKENWSDPIPEELEPFYCKRDRIILDGSLIRMKPGRQIIVPSKIRDEILKIIHRSHFGIVRSKARARAHVWWPKMAEEIEEFVKQCKICQQNAPNPPRDEPHHKWPEAKFPFERVHSDLAGPIWGANFLIVVDAYSKYPFVYQTHSTHSSALITLLQEIFAQFGSPRTFVTDNGPQFVSNEMEMFLGKEGIRHLTSPTYHPASNGEAERFVRTFKEGMVKLIAEGKSLKNARLELLQEYRAALCAATGGNSPALKFLGREIRTLLDKIKMPTRSGKDGKNTVDKEGSANGEKIRKEPPKGQFEPGDIVWIKSPDGKWEPGILLQPIGERIWEVELEGSMATKTAHRDQIKARRTSAARRH